MNVKFADLRIHDETTISAVTSVLNKGSFIQGSYHQLFSEAWADYCKTDYAVLTSSGTAALVAALKYFKTNYISYVIVPNISFAATAFAVREAGMIPLYCEVDKHGLMDLNHCQELLRTYDKFVTAVMPVHLYGQLAELPDTNVPIIQDACQAHGIAKFNGEANYTACYSFYPAKNLGAAGDAGALVTNIQALRDYASAYISYGDYPGEKYVHNFVGNNLRCDEIQAAVLYNKLNKLDVHNAIRSEIAYTYIANGVESYVNGNNVWHLYPILVDDPNHIRQLLNGFGVTTGNHYPYVLSDICFGAEDGFYAAARHIARHVVTLPIGPHMTTTDAVYVADCLKKIAKYDGELWRVV